MSIKRIFYKLLYSPSVIFPLVILLIIVHYKLRYKSIDDSYIESLTSLVRTILLTDVHRLPARQMSSNELRSENLSNHFLVTSQGCNDILPLRYLTERLRIYRDYKLKYFLSEGSSRLLINEFEENVFPWIRKSDSLLNEYKSGTKGIVMCLNNKYLQIGISSIMALQVIGNKLPIEIMFYGNDELSMKNRNILKKLPFIINIIDISVIFNNSRQYLPIGERISGTYVKPFGILASSFQHVLLMDADVYFFQKPSILLDHTGYLNRNFLIFNDRTIWRNKRRSAYIQSIMPQPWSIKFNKSRLVNSISGHETESGVVLVNKGIQKSYLALLTTCLLNTRCYRREMLGNEQYNGEKETYWLGLEMIQAPYYKINQVGVLGDFNEKENIVCGQLFHGDESQNPLWWNGGFRRLKSEKNSSWTIFTSYMWEVKHNTSLWEWPCLTRSSQKVQKLNDQQLKLIQIYKIYNCTTFDC